MLGVDDLARKRHFHRLAPGRWLDHDVLGRVQFQRRLRPGARRQQNMHAIGVRRGIWRKPRKMRQRRRDMARLLQKLAGAGDQRIVFIGSITPPGSSSDIFPAPCLYWRTNSSRSSSSKAATCTHSG